jgi:hypothetical protein
MNDRIHYNPRGSLFHAALRPDYDKCMNPVVDATPKRAPGEARAGIGFGRFQLPCELQLLINRKAGIEWCKCVR